MKNGVYNQAAIGNGTYNAALIVTKNKISVAIFSGEFKRLNGKNVKRIAFEREFYEHDTESDKVAMFDKGVAEVLNMLVQNRAINYFGE